MKGFTAGTMLMFFCVLVLIATPRHGSSVTGRTVVTDPPANIPIGEQPPFCYEKPGSSECKHWIVKRLNEARKSIGQPNYRLPTNFYSISYRGQLLTLTNNDRVLAELPRVNGLTHDLDAAAALGVAQRTDPRPPSGITRSGWGSVWASTGALRSYYLWMFDDGPNGPNSDCKVPSDWQCWGHRHVLLGSWTVGQEPIAAGFNSAASGSAGLIVNGYIGATFY